MHAGSKEHHSSPQVPTKYARVSALTVKRCWCMPALKHDSSQHRSLPSAGATQRQEAGALAR